MLKQWPPTTEVVGLNLGIEYLLDCMLEEFINTLPKVAVFPRVLQFPPTGKVDRELLKANYLKV